MSSGTDMPRPGHAATGREADIKPRSRDVTDGIEKTAAIRIVENLRAEMVKCQTGTGGSGCTS